jgi:hypothetical protein
MSSFSGSGGPPPKMAREQGIASGGGAKKPYGFRLYEKLPNGKNKVIQMITLDQDKTTKKGEKNCKILIVDDAPPGGDEWQPSVFMHERFRFNGSWDNYFVSRHKTPEGCPMSVALQEPHKHAAWCKEDCAREGLPDNRRGKWRWVATGIKMKPYTIRKGPNAGKVIPYTRGLILAPEEQYKTLLTYRKAYGSLRGRMFSVSRNDGAFSSRIGDVWDPVTGEPAWTDEKLMDYFKNAAAEYGLKPEDYVRPFDYSSILALPTLEAAREAAKFVAAERGIDLDNPTAPKSANPVAETIGEGADEENPETDVPF